MIQLDLNDISLLYKKITILPQDRSVEKSESKPTEVVKVKPPSVEKAVEKDTPDPPNNEKAAFSVKEPPVEYVSKKQPMLVYVSAELKSQYLEEGSSFLKILGALNAKNISKYLITNAAVLDNVLNYESVWCFGLSLKQEKKVQQSGHKNLLCSPDVLSLQTKEDKQLMYSPAKQFVFSNQEMVSKL